MDIIPSFLAEEDTRYMKDSLILAIGSVCNHVLSRYIKEYMENPASDKEVVERLNTLIGPKVVRNTFHIEVIDNGTKDIISNFSLEALAEQELDMDMILKNIIYVNENKEKLIATIDPRTKADYDTLIKEATAFDRDTASFKDMIKYPYLSKRIQANKRIFYSPNELPVSTRMKPIINKYGDLAIAEKGIAYIKYCQQHDINGYLRCEF